MNKPQSIIVHHTAVSRAKAPVQFDAVNRYHQSLWHFRSSLGFYGGYHYFIEASGVVKQYRKDDEDGAHTIGENKRSIGVCLAGNFDVEFPTIEQTNALRDLLRVLVARYNLPTSSIYPHRKFAGKTCYGTNLQGDWASRLAEVPATTDDKHEVELLAKVSHIDLPRDVLLRFIRAIINLRK
jgi:N-acetylmuramoyl-L-alanine amidase